MDSRVRFLGGVPYNNKKEDMNTKRVGNVGESAVLYEFVKRGIPVYVPFGDNEACDLIAEFNGKLQKIQVKTAQSVKSGKINFKLTSTRYDSRYKYTEEDIDYFALHCIENGKTYLLKKDSDTNLMAINLRLNPTGNNQTQGVRMAEDYEIDKILPC